MTSHDSIVPVHGCPGPEKSAMRDFRRPTLCVIDENGCEISQADDLKCWNGEESDLHGREISCSLNGYYSRDFNDNVTSADSSRFLSSSAEKNFDLNELKATTARLKLSTRRQSTVAWQQEHLHSTNNRVLPKFDVSKLCDHKDDIFTEERKNRINEALAWLKTELQNMRKEDEKLAHKLLSIRHDIHQLKLQRGFKEHQDMLEDVTLDMEENHELHEISDFPLPDSVHDTPLRHLGVTRMHLSARRFSTC